MAKSKTTKPKTSIQTVQKDPSYVGTARISSFNTSRQNYARLYLFLYGSIRKDYRYRKNKIGFMFDDGVIVKMKVRTAIINLIFWKPYVDYNRKITADTLFDTAIICEDAIASKMDFIIDEFRDTVEIDDLCVCLSHIIESLAQIAKDFCKIIGNTIGLRDIIDLANRNPEFNEILHTQYADGTPISDIEKDISVRNMKMKDIIENDVQSNIRPFLKAGGNVNLGQMSQCLVCIGPRSDIYGNIPPVIINTNFVLGLRNVSDYYLESYACRKSLIANKYQMSDSGYTSRMMDLLSVDSCLVDIEDCGTTATVEVFIPDNNTLKAMELKNIVTGVDKKGKPIFHCIRPAKDKNLIGTTVKVRSPIVCGLGEGHICKRCYGNMAYVTLGYHTGIIASHALSEPLSQTVLSTKHLIKTRSRQIAWSTKMKTFFVCDTESVLIQPEVAKRSVEIGFFTEDIEEYLNMFDDISPDDEDESSDRDDMLLDYVTRFVLIVDGETIPFDNMDTELYINQEFLSKILKSNRIEDGIIYVSLTGHPLDQPVFDINIENMEIGVYLKRIMQLLGIKSKVAYTTYEDLFKILTAAIIEVGIKVNIIHIEAIMYSMLRDPDMMIHRPNFSEQNPSYTILPTCSAIMYARSLTTSLSYERIGMQMANVYTYYKKANGFFDPFFR